MTQNLLKRIYLGSQLSDDEMRDIPHYRAELHWHVLYKNIQVGCILGMGVIGPLIGLYKGRSLNAMGQYAFKGGKVGCAVLIPLAPIITEAAIRNSDEDGIYDRSYRIRYNEGQMMADRCATYGGLAGFGAGVAAGVSPLALLMAGFGLGTVLSGVYNNVLKKKE